MNKATFERSMKAAAQGKPLKEVQILDEDGETYDISGVHFDPESDVIFIKVMLHE